MYERCSKTRCQGHHRFFFLRRKAPELGDGDNERLSDVVRLVPPESVDDEIERRQSERQNLQFGELEPLGCSSATLENKPERLHYSEELRKSVGLALVVDVVFRD